MSENGLNQGDDGRQRCWWCGNDPLYIKYHDEEWGRQQTDDIRLFEKLCLEGFQAGLSWLTILRKRENFRAAFDEFDFFKISQYGEGDVARLLQNEGIIRHEGKIRSVINNARQVTKIIDKYGVLYDYFKEFKPRNESGNKSYEVLKSITQTPESNALSKDLKKRGFSFVGPTTMYAMMQAMGMVNDHVEGCFIRKDCEI